MNVTAKKGVDTKNSMFNNFSVLLLLIFFFYNTRGFCFWVFFIIIFLYVLDFCGKVLVAGGYRGGFCEKLLESSPMSDRANASRLQDGPTTGQGQANQ